MKAVLVSAIGLILIGQLLPGSLADTLVIVSAVLFVYFLGFNILEASQLAPGNRKGAATKRVQHHAVDRARARRRGGRMARQARRRGRRVLCVLGACLVLAYNRSQYEGAAQKGASTLEVSGAT